MAPAAITPPVIEVKSFQSLKSQNIVPVDTSNIDTKRKIICFSDFDGTIFMQGTGHILFNSFGCGSERRKVFDSQIHTGERSFRDVPEEMWGSLDVPFNGISAGLKPEESHHIDIVANAATISSDGSEWKPVWLHDCELGHDKAKPINDYKSTARLESADGTVPMIVFIGDGVSDLPAACEADVLFAHRGLRLEEYCIEDKLSYIPFDTFADIQREVIKIAKKDEIKTKGRTAVPGSAMMSPREKVVEWPGIYAQLRAQTDGAVLEGMEGIPVAAPAA
ncbi:hypothetical protein K458DRAFT_444527 [Lentithecium fluviatile CBS 122367]|uniref:HAD-like protein n=1 Tax=Lentithecium fluviatile CBS 122367 TaxID=1168545 RepID=A0A6G1IUM1_9PLEO|nr:hypothetical protein K458DRAFT_444527 [Lentithecium fluviatile CBS 122367]